MNGLMVMLFLLIAEPLVGTIIGVVKFFSSDSQIKNSGRQWLLAAVILFAEEILIGYPLCSGVGIGGGH